MSNAPPSTLSADTGKASELSWSLGSCACCRMLQNVLSRRYSNFSQIVTLEADETDEVGEEFIEAIEDIEDVGDGLCKWIVLAGISEPRMCFVHVGATACRTYFDFSFPDDFVITTFVKFLGL